MPQIEFMKTYHYWEDDKIYKAGEIFDVDYVHYRELIDTGVAKPYQDCEKTKATKYVLKCSIIDIVRILVKHKVTIAETATSKDFRVLLFLVQILLSSGKIKPNEILELPGYEGRGSIGGLINEAYNW